jgi:hypothetical protein
VQGLCKAASAWNIMLFERANSGYFVEISEYSKLARKGAKRIREGLY